MGLGLKHQTVGQLLGRFRVEYAEASGEHALRMASWLVTAIEAGDVTDAQARAAFGPGWGQIKARMTQMRDTRRAAKAAKGE